VGISIDRERDLLAIFLKDPAAFYEHRHRLRPGDFTDQQTRAAFVGLETVLESSNGTIDLEELARVLGEAPAFSDTPSRTWLLDLQDKALPSAAVEHRIRAVKSEALRRRLRLEMGNALTELEHADPLEIHHQLRERAAELVEEHADVADPFRQGITLADIVAEPTEHTERILGDLLPKQSLALFLGKPGRGKTQLLLQLAHATTTGGKWLDTFQARETRTGLVLLETDNAELQDRIGAITEPGDDWASRCYCMTRTDLGSGRFYLADPLDPAGAAARLDRLERWIVENRLGLVALDPLVKIARIRETHREEDSDRALDALERLFMATGAAVLVPHHEPKHIDDGASGDLMAARGSMRLVDEPPLVMRVGLQKGTLALRFPKVRYAKPPNTIYLHQGDSYRIDRRDEPKSPGDLKAARLGFYGRLLPTRESWSSVEIMQELPADLRVGDSAIKAELRKLAEAGKITKTSNGKRWRILERWERKDDLE